MQDASVRLGKELHLHIIRAGLQAQLSGAVHAELFLDAGAGVKYTPPLCWSTRRRAWNRRTRFLLEWENVYLLSIHRNCQAVSDKKDVLTFIKQRSVRNKHKNNDNDLGFLHLHGAAIFANTTEDGKLFSMAAHKNPQSFSFLLSSCPVLSPLIEKWSGSALGINGPFITCQRNQLPAADLRC